MTRPISLETLRELNKDNFMVRCCLCGSTQVFWHHNLIFGGAQCDEPWSILPVCKSHHDRANNSEVRDKLDHIMLNRAADEQLRPYCKVFNWIKRKEELNKVYNKGNLL